MQDRESIARKFEWILKDIQGDETGRLNDMLNPIPIWFDEKSCTAIIKFEAKDWQKNHRGEVHGGAIASMFDTAMGMSVLAFSEYMQVATADLDVSFIRPFTGKSFLFEVEIVRLGRSMARVRALAKDEETEKTLASATSNFVYG